MARGPGNLTTEGKAEKLSQPRWQEVSSGPLALLMLQAGNAASPTADEDKAPDPSASSLRARYAASRARPAPAEDFIGGPASRQAPPTAHGRPAPSRARAVLRARAPGWPWPVNVVSFAQAAGDSRASRCLPHLPQGSNVLQK